jgi:hypothetical protein
MTRRKERRDNSRSDILKQILLDTHDILDDQSTQTQPELQQDYATM